MATNGNGANTSNSTELITSPNDTGPNTATPTIDESPSRASLPASDQQKSTMLSRIKDWSPVLVLENSGSVARDHLASERTWLAYIRTSLAISSAGVALVQLFTIAANRSPSEDPFHARIQRFARPLGATAVLIGLGVALLGLYRYFVIQSSLTTGKFPTARAEVHLISILLAALIAVVFGVLVAYPR